MLHGVRLYALGAAAGMEDCHPGTRIGGIIPEFAQRISGT